MLKLFQKHICGVYGVEMVEDRKIIVETTSFSKSQSRFSGN